MTWLVELAYHPTTAPEQRRITTERVEATDPDSAIGLARAQYLTKATGRIEFRRVRRLPDYIVRADGSLSLIFPQNESAREWLEDHVDDEAQWMGHALVVENRYLGDLVESLRNDGFTVGV